MRSLLALVAVLASGCLPEIEGVDGAGTPSGTSFPEPEQMLQPRVTGAFDKPALTTQLAKSEQLTLSLTSADGFAGDVTLVRAQLVDSAGTPPTDVTLTAPMSSTLTLAAGATQTATYGIEIPMNALGATFVGNLKVDLMSAAGPTTVSSAVTIEAIYTLDYKAGTAYAADKHTNAGNVPELAVKRGAILRFKNSDVIDHVIHGSGAFTNYHENTVSGGAAGRTYEIPTSGIPAGTSGVLGCYNHGTGTYSTYTVL